jgi:hypothetical protein
MDTDSILCEVGTKVVYRSIFYINVSLQRDKIRIYSLLMNLQIKMADYSDEEICHIGFTTTWLEFRLFKDSQIIALSKP